MLIFYNWLYVKYEDNNLKDNSTITNSITNSFFG